MTFLMKKKLLQQKFYHKQVIVQKNHIC